MGNPFDLIDARLSNIENLLLDLKHGELIQSTQPHPDKLLTVQEAAEFLNIAVPTIYSKVSLRELPHHKRGKRLYFSLDDLIAYVKDGKRLTWEERKALSNTKKGLKNG